jgi:hypothetical protein
MSGGVKLTGQRCSCCGCGALFNSVSVFDRHRIGSFGTLRQPGDRRCVTEAEVLARGWVTSAGGFWMRGARPGALHRRTGAVTPRVEAAIVLDPTPTYRPILPPVPSDAVAAPG